MILTWGMKTVKVGYTVNNTLHKPLSFSLQCKITLTFCRYIFLFNADKEVPFHYIIKQNEPDDKKKSLKWLNMRKNSPFLWARMINVYYEIMSTKKVSLKWYSKYCVSKMFKGELTCGGCEGRLSSTNTGLIIIHLKHTKESIVKQVPRSSIFETDYIKLRISLVYTSLF